MNELSSLILGHPTGNRRILYTTGTSFVKMYFKYSTLFYILAYIELIALDDFKGIKIDQ